MDLQILILLLSFTALLLMDVPVAVCIGVATVLTMYSIGEVPTEYITAQRLSTGIASFPLLAIPFFVLAGVLMGAGGMARRLMDFANALVGGFHNGLSYVNTITCMLFGAVSGSAAAAVSSIGSFMMPEMERKGYGRPFSVALTTTSATTGLLIPPSNIMIVYAVVAGNVSITSLFIAGVVPGMVVGGLLMVASWWVQRKNRSEELSHASPRKMLISFLQAVPSLALIFIVMGGILGGIFSATEASAVAALYAFLLGVVFYREVKIKQIPEVLLQSAKTTAIVMFLVGASQAMSWVLSYEMIPQTVSDAMLAISDSPIVTLLIINILLLVVGTFMDMTPAVLIFTPIFLPVVTGFGMDPVHFGIMMIANLCIGLCTPPVGTCLFVGCGVGKTTLAQVMRPLVPMFIAMFAGLLIISYVPAVSLWLPNFIESLLPGQ
ncbi:MAG: TRAP transporter large permease [Verrucomicrobiota bacterium JB022]|nr:TRAP transporter large permease [Verrucomicrobiota bacterium JB022]